MTASNEIIIYKARWYFGGLAAAAGVMITHPLDLIKVLLQTQPEKLPIKTVVINVVKNNSVLSLYNGISASVVRQLTYSMSRFAFYEAGRPYIPANSLVAKMILAGASGFVGGFIGVPTDVVNVRMQNDVRLPPDKRRNYKHVFDGLIRIYREEGIGRSFGGASTASVRGSVMTIGQIAFYDQIKGMLLKTPYFEDNIGTHLTASISAATIATLMCQPLDVLKTRLMNAKHGEFSGVMDAIIYTAKRGPLEFFTGIIPAFARLGPQTVLMLVFYEQLRLNFGIPVTKKGSK